VLVTSSNKEARRKSGKSIPSSGLIDLSLSTFAVKVCGVVGSKAIAMHLGAL
jgi:hypothetical protein